MKDKIPILQDKTGNLIYLDMTEFAKSPVVIVKLKPKQEVEIWM